MRGGILYSSEGTKHQEGNGVTGCPRFFENLSMTFLRPIFLKPIDNVLISKVIIMEVEIEIIRTEWILNLTFLELFNFCCYTI